MKTKTIKLSDIVIDGKNSDLVSMVRNLILTEGEVCGVSQNSDGMPTAIATISKTEEVNYFNIEILWIGDSLRSGTKSGVKQPVKSDHIPLQLESLEFDYVSVRKWKFEPLDIPEGDIYFLHSEINNLIKIGFSSSIKSRISDLRSMSPVKLKLLGRMDGGMKQEKELHKMFSSVRSHGEWFHASEKLMTFIKGITK